MRAELASIPYRTTERKLIGFLVGEVVYGADIIQVREIVNPIKLIRLPTAPAFVIGVADHREEMVPVIDLRVRFGIGRSESQTKGSKWILVKTDDKDVGLLVDRVTEVLKVSESQRRESHPLLKDPRAPWIKDVFGTRTGLVFELDLDAVVGCAGELEILADSQEVSP